MLGANTGWAYYSVGVDGSGPGSESMSDIEKHPIAISMPAPMVLS